MSASKSVKSVPAKSAPAKNVQANTAAPINGLTALVANANAPAATVQANTAKDNNAVVQALANGGMENLLECNNKGSFWQAHARQIGKGLPQWPQGFTLGKLTNGPCGVVGKADHALSVLAIGAAVNGTLTNAAACEIGLAPHNIRAWLKRGWIHTA